MSAASPQKLKLIVDGADAVSALLLRPPSARACFVFAHGAGAGMTPCLHGAVAAGLCDRGIATLRYQFPYMEKGSRRPDPPRSRMPRCGPPWRRPRDAVLGSLLSPAANRSAAA